MIRRPRVIAVADSDSYVKWGAHLVDRMPENWDVELCVLQTPWMPSDAQLEAALAGTRWGDAPPAPMSLDRVQGRIAQFRPDAVVVATRGPSVKVVVRTAFATGHRPVIVSGLPGISFPPTRKAVAYRALADLVVVHSRREREGYDRLSERMGIPQRFALASLPFLSQRPSERVEESPGPIIFAAQAKFPAERHERIDLLVALADLARARPHQRVVVKTRGEVGEAQTHPERHDYRDLMAEVDAPPNLVVAGGPMSQHLRTASALVTVSSTAMLEAIAQGVPVLALQDWGIRKSFVNNGFVGGGFLGTLDDLRAGVFRHPLPEWLDDNWFHADSAADWTDRLVELMIDRDLGVLPERMQRTGTSGGALRHAWDRRQALGRYDGTALGWLAMVVGTPALRALLAYRRLRRRLRALGLRVSGPAPTEEEPDEVFAPA